MKRIMRVALMMTAVVGIVSATESRGALQASDSYLIGSDPTAGEYNDITPSDNQLKNQSPELTNQGFVTGPYNQGTGTGQFGATSNGLNFAPLNEASDTSGKVNYSAAPLDGLTRTVARALDGLTQSNTYWISHLVNRGSIPLAGGDGYVLTGFGNTVQPAAGTTSGFLEGAYVGFAQDGVVDNFGNLVIRYRPGAEASTIDEIVLDGSQTSTFGTTYAVVMKVDINVDGGSADSVSWWLNPTNFLSEETLTSSAFSSGTFESFAYQSPSIARLNYAAYNWNGNAFFDAPRLSTSLEGLGGVAIEGVPGDYNEDGTVNLADYTVWRDNDGASLALPNENPDSTTPGVVDEEDYLFWKANFGQPLPPEAGIGLSSTASVPEPGSCLLCFATGAIVWRLSGSRRRG